LGDSSIIKIFMKTRTCIYITYLTIQFSKMTNKLKSFIKETNVCTSVLNKYVKLFFYKFINTNLKYISMVIFDEIRSYINDFQNKSLDSTLFKNN